jgi:hypothetical protein
MTRRSSQSRMRVACLVLWATAVALLLGLGCSSEESSTAQCPDPSGGVLVFEVREAGAQWVRDRLQAFAEAGCITTPVDPPGAAGAGP